MSETTTSPKRTLLAIIVALVIVLIIRVLFTRLEAIMHANSPYGIVDFELAFTGDRAGQILSQWDNAAVDAARSSLLLDFLFIPAYAVAFAGITNLLTHNRPPLWRRIAKWIVNGVIAAALLDILENVMLLIQLPGDVIRALPPLIAGISASVKFSLLGISIIFWIAAGISRLAQRNKASAV